ncbi:MAG: hypothetical protein Q4A64_08800, partial [Porphyromonadaceae bacterium]|nr:hypothetical protein [Porphyromonadaceae bacterium]
EVPPRGHAIVVALLETYNEMRGRDSRWSASRGITAEMEQDALDSLKHYGSIDKLREAMRRAEGVEWIKSKKNLSRLAWLIQLKNLIAIEEGAYDADYARPQMTISPKTAGVPLPIDDQKMESLRRRFEANIIKPSTQ